MDEALSFKFSFNPGINLKVSTGLALAIKLKTNRARPVSGWLAMVVMPLNQLKILPEHENPNHVMPENHTVALL